MATSQSNARTASGINVIAGIWLIIAPWALGYSNIDAAVWNDVLVGIAVVILAGIRTATPNRSTGVSWANVALGVWLIIAPFILQYGAYAMGNAGAAFWNDILLGIAVAALAWASAASTQRVTR